jgi:hypothetical protein
VHDTPICPNLWRCEEGAAVFQGTRLGRIGVQGYVVSVRRGGMVLDHAARQPGVLLQSRPATTHNQPHTSTLAGMPGLPCCVVQHHTPSPECTYPCTPVLPSLILGHGSGVHWRVAPTFGGGWTEGPARSWFVSSSLSHPCYRVGWVGGGGSG